MFSVKDPRRPIGVGLTTVTSRAVLPPLDDANGRADLVAERLRDAIRLGLVLDGERLPSETVLAEQLRVSTVTLREALAVLRDQGLIRTRRGRGGGSFIHAPAEHFEQTLLVHLSAWSIEDLRELGDHRAAILGMAAGLAADRALDAELGRMERQVERLSVATSPGERRRADTQFSIEVTAAAQSSRLSAEELRLRAEVGALLWHGAQAARDHRAAVSARRRLVAAIRRRSHATARSLAEQLVAVDTRRLIQLRLDDYRGMSPAPEVP